VVVNPQYLELGEAAEAVLLADIAQRARAAGVADVRLHPAYQADGAAFYERCRASSKKPARCSRDTPPHTHTILASPRKPLSALSALRCGFVAAAGGAEGAPLRFVSGSEAPEAEPAAAAEAVAAEPAATAGPVGAEAGAAR